MSYPAALEKIVGLLSSLPEEERREVLINYSEQASRHAPKPDEHFDLVDIRKDEECTDTVGIFLRVDETGCAHFRVTLGPQVQTLTKALTTILCKAFEGVPPAQVLETPADFVPKLVGAELVRARSQTVYYLLSRMKSACKVWMNRQRAQD